MKKRPEVKPDDTPAEKPETPEDISTDKPSGSKGNGTSDQKDTSVKTGNESHVFSYILLLWSALGAIVLVKKKKRQM